MPHLGEHSMCWQSASIACLLIKLNFQFYNKISFFKLSSTSNSDLAPPGSFAKHLWDNTIGKNRIKTHSPQAWQRRVYYRWLVQLVTTRHLFQQQLRTKYRENGFRTCRDLQKKME
jgi:hypothetical protein